MHPKKLLLIIYYWPPSGGGGVQRWVKFIKYLPKFNWKTVVYYPENPDYPLVDPEIGKDIPDNQETVSGKIIEPFALFNFLNNTKKKGGNHGNILSKGKKVSFFTKVAIFIRGNFFIPDARMFWIKPSIKHLSKYIENNQIDLIVSSGPPHSVHLIALALKRKFNIKWVADFRDAWSQIDYFDDLKLSKWARNKHLNLEKKVLDNADLVITVGKNLAKDLGTLTNTPIEVFTNGFDSSDYESFIEKKHTNSKTTISHIGTISFSQNPEVLWQAIFNLRQEISNLSEKLQIKIIGKIDESVRESVNSYELENIVSFYSYLPHSEAIEAQLDSDILLLSINQSHNNKQIVTGKIFEYLATKKPIICIGPRDGDAAEIIIKANAGIVIDYNEKENLKTYLSDFIKQKSSQKINSTNLEIYTREHISRELAKSLNNLIYTNHT